MTIELVTISKKEYDELCERDEWLTYLEAAGVDNWDGFEYAMELRDEEKDHA